MLLPKSAIINDEPRAADPSRGSATPISRLSIDHPESFRGSSFVDGIINRAVY